MFSYCNHEEVKDIELISILFQPSSKPSNSGEVDDKVRVVVRVRPLSQKEVKENRHSIVRVNQSTCNVSVTNPHSNSMSEEPPKTFTFDSVFGIDSKQVAI